MTQEQTAQKLGLTQATYSRYENGMNEPDLEMLKKFSRLFDCSIDFLLECDETDNSATRLNCWYLFKTEFLPKTRRESPLL